MNQHLPTLATEIRHCCKFTAIKTSYSNSELQCFKSVTFNVIAPAIQIFDKAVDYP